MIEKPLFKVNSNSLHIPQVNPDQEEVLQQEVYFIENNNVLVRRILESGVTLNEFPFESQDVEEVILSNVEVQFALCQFYTMYDTDASNQPKYIGELHYFNNEAVQLSDKIIFRLLSIFDSLRVAYKKGKAHVQITLSSASTMGKIYNVYQELHKEDRLNPFIKFFLGKGQKNSLQNTLHDTFQYRPDISELHELETNQEERIFIEFIQNQLMLSPYFVCYCAGWSEEEVFESRTMKKLAKYFQNIFFLSGKKGFQTVMLIICN
ncbi:hypothetical protein B4V02_05615 [Paenibacillus kribbensis]|uniref:Uncharacterized protein n=1 Tax=Paenibacillus kribbensis TaxID=172713 RepID=A0A222WJK8_9BACL|nr:hypothetical protein [Paenibacillus kribbensis]ASR46202.1 hypothetical protein B4V02_05615 [Paenibacillus kribbensis]